MKSQTIKSGNTIDAVNGREEVADDDRTVKDRGDVANEETADDGIDERDADEADPKTRTRRLSISLSVRSLIVALIIVVLVCLAGSLAWLYIGTRSQLAAQARDSADNVRAERMSLDYAVNAATLDYKNLQPWKVKLVAGTSEELTRKLSDAAGSMEQILSPLQWTSTAQPLVAKVRSKTGGTIVVDTFVSVQTKTVQAPDPLQSTATYAITIDTNNNWLITDVGGTGSVVGAK